MPLTYEIIERCFEIMIDEEFTLVDLHERDTVLLIQPYIEPLTRAFGRANQGLRMLRGPLVAELQCVNLLRRMLEIVRQEEDCPLVLNKRRKRINGKARETFYVLTVAEQRLP